MIVRIVQMTFLPEMTGQFEQVFEESKQTIITFPGCLHVEMLRDVNTPEKYFTYSHWNSEADLNNYRSSDFFAATWMRTKALFAGKAQAWSLEQKSKADA